MNKSSKIYIAGHTGMVGSAIVRKLVNDNFSNFIHRTHKDLDLTNQEKVSLFFNSEKPDYVFIAAAKVGGIHANNIYRADFLYENLMIQSNIIQAAFKNNVKKLLFLGSACIYPRNAPQPINEKYLLSDRLEPTNEPYAVAKIAGIKLCENYYRQYGSNFITIMPNNLYGPNDNFNLKTSHVLPALIRKFHEAKQKRIQNVEVWGTGIPKREFLYVDDLADACIFLMRNLEAIDLYESKISHLNVGSGEEISIKDLAKTIQNIIGFDGELEFNTKFPDGMARKLLDVSRIKKLGWSSKTNLEVGLEKTYEWFINNYHNCI